MQVQVSTCRAAIDVQRLRRDALRLGAIDKVPVVEQAKGRCWTNRWLLSWLLCRSVRWLRRRHSEGVGIVRRAGRPRSGSCRRLNTAKIKESVRVEERSSQAPSVVRVVEIVRVTLQEGIERCC